MANLTIKNMPDCLHRCLKENAKKHHRSLNGELLYVLEQHLQPMPGDVQKTLKEIRALRRKMKGVWATPEEVDQAKRVGRE